MGLISEFKEFAYRGNVIDLAIGIVIGAAFKGIVDSFVADIIMPPIGLLTNNIDFKHLKIVLREAQGTNPAVSINIGLFIQTIISFVIIAFCVFLLVKLINNFKRKEEAPATQTPVISSEEKILTEIRDILKNK